MFQKIPLRAARMLVTVPLLAIVFAVASPLSVASAISVTFSVTSDCVANGTSGTFLEVLHVNPPGTYSWAWKTQNLTTGASTSGSSVVYGPGTFSGNDQFYSGPIVVNSGDVIKVTYTVAGITTVNFPCGGGDGANFNDGRCNQEPYQSVAVYPDGKGGYNFYALFNGVGYFAMHVTEQNLDDNPDTGVTHKIAEAKGVQLFRLAGGGLQVNRMGKDNKMYSFNIGTCGAMED